MTQTNMMTWEHYYYYFHQDIHNQKHGKPPHANSWLHCLLSAPFIKSEPNLASMSKH